MAGLRGARTGQPGVGLRECGCRGAQHGGRRGQASATDEDRGSQLHISYDAFRPQMVARGWRVPRVPRVPIPVPGRLATAQSRSFARQTGTILILSCNKGLICRSNIVASNISCNQSDVLIYSKTERTATSPGRQVTTMSTGP